MPALVTARLFGGRYNGWREALPVAVPPQTITVVMCVPCARLHLQATDHWRDWPDDLPMYWLDREEWEEIGRDGLFASYTLADPASDLHVTVRERELLARTGAALGLDLETGRRVSGPGTWYEH